MVKRSMFVGMDGHKETGRGTYFGTCGCSSAGAQPRYKELDSASPAVRVAGSLLPSRVVFINSSHSVSNRVSCPKNLIRRGLPFARTFGCGPEPADPSQNQVFLGHCVTSRGGGIFALAHV